MGTFSFFSLLSLNVSILGLGKVRTSIKMVCQQFVMVLENSPITPGTRTVVCSAPRFVGLGLRTGLPAVTINPSNLVTAKSVLTQTQTYPRVERLESRFWTIGRRIESH